jgi:RND family efflux transporter MFP subunit
MKLSRLLFVVFLSTGLILSAGCRRSHSPAANDETTAPVPVEVVNIERARVSATEDVVGTVSARSRATISAKITGRIEELRVAPGQKVAKGELLARLDAREIKARLDQAQAVLKQEEADRARFERLLKSKAVTRQEFDAVDTRFRVAVAGLKRAETTLDYSKISAPFDGVITRKLADVGDLLAPGKPLLEMEDTSALQLEAGVPEALVGQLSLGMKLSARAGTPEKKLTCVVDEISPSASPGSRTFLVKCTLPKAEGVRAGQFGRVGIPVAEKETLRIPASALVVRGQLEMVFVAVEGRALMRLVKSGRQDGDTVELLSGVEAGEQVIISGAATLRDGQAISIRK